MPVQSIEMVMMIAGALEELVDDVVFVGGCATPLLVEEYAQPEARVTVDVDFVIEAAVMPDYYRFAERIRAKGFREDMMGDGPLCRWRLPVHGGSLIVDVMPTEADVLGFANPWYPEAFDRAQQISLPNTQRIRVIAPLYFIATKFDAWSQRGRGDMGHKDIEDIVFILENRPRIPVEYLDETNDRLKTYLREQSRSLLNNTTFSNYLPGMVSGDAGQTQVLNSLSLLAR